jgi:hypothetical protein
MINANNFAADLGQRYRGGCAFFVASEFNRVARWRRFRATTVLTNTRSRPWTANGFGTSFNDAKIAAKMKDADLHFHDLRGHNGHEILCCRHPDSVDRRNYGLG